MNYNRPLIIALIALLSLCSIVVSAAEPDAAYIESRITQRANNITDTSNADVTVYRKQGGGKVIVRNQNNNKNAEFAIKANAKTLAGRFARGANAAALAYAVVAILGEGVDWVLDPKNNQIVYPGEYTLYYNRELTQYLKTYTIVDLTTAKSETQRFFDVVHDGTVVHSCDFVGQSIQCYYRLKSDKSGYRTIVLYPTQTTDNIPLETVANYVISNEDNSTTNNITNNYYNAVNDTLAEQIDNGNYDPDIKSAFDQVNDKDPSPSDKPSDSTGTHTSPNSDTNSDTPQEQPSDKPQDQSKPFELPAFCDWAGKVCDWIDWTRQEPPEPPEPQKVPNAELSHLGLDESELFRQRVQFNGQCPQHELKFEINGKQIVEPIPTYHFCNLIEQIAPWLLAFTYMSSGFFVIRSL